MAKDPLVVGRGGHVGDVTKLPKWAQQHIHNLTRDLAYANKKLMAGPEDANTFADPYYNYTESDSGQSGKALGHDTIVEYRFEGERNYLQCKIERDKRDGEYLRVYGSDSFVVKPNSSNVVEIQLRRR